jgi:2-oxoglutarate ferredoxin oxidoreductase subunit alpha
MYELTIQAFNLSERYRVPAMVMADEAVGHLRENISVGAKVDVCNRKKHKGGAPFGTEEKDGVPPMPSFGEGARLLVTGSTHDPSGFRKTDDPGAHAKLVERINEKILRNRSRIVETERYFLEDSEIAVIAYGFTARTSLYAVKRLRKERLKVGLLRLKTLWPFPEEAIVELNEKVKKVVVPEMNQGQVAGEVRKFYSGEMISLRQTNGEIIQPEKILKVLTSGVAHI